jgi:hypothetical protein
MQPRFDLSEGVPALWIGWERGFSRGPYDHPECEIDRNRSGCQPTMNVGMIG